jgi:acyl carrier protein
MSTSILEDEIREFILATVIDEMNILMSRDGITDESLVTVGGLELDSLSLIELTLRLESRFGVEIPDTDIEPLAFLTLGGLVAEVVRRGAKVMSAGATASGEASEGDPAPSPITTDTVRELLSDRKIFPGVSADLGEDAELILDSLGLVWLLHVVEERYGLVVEPTDEDIAGLTSLRQLTEYLRAAQTDRAEGGRRDER